MNTIHLTPLLLNLDHLGLVQPMSPLREGVSLLFLLNGKPHMRRARNGLYPLLKMSVSQGKIAIQPKKRG
jgi:hypothetical protein